MTQNRKDKKKSRLAFRFILYILLFSTLITLLGTSYQLYLDYRHEISSIEAAFDQIEKTYQHTIENNLWVSDIDQLEIQLYGILDLPGLKHIRIIKDDKSIISLGRMPGKRVIERSYPLSYSFRGQDVDLGVLHISASLEKAYQHLFDQVFVILTTQAVKIFLISFFIFFLFYMFIGKHLEKLARYAREFSLDNLEAPIFLDRKKPEDSTPDELDAVVYALNDMRLKLSRDIEARLQAEKELVQSERRLNIVLESLPIGVWFTDKNGKIIYCNPEGQNIWQGARFVDQDEFYMHKAWRLPSNELVKAEEWAVTKAIEKHETTIEEELEIECFDGTHKIILNSAVPLIDSDGTITGALAVNQDITEQKKLVLEKEQLEKQWKQAQKLEAVGTLAGGIAHDFNNILAAIIGYSELAKDDAPPDSRLSEDLDQILAAAVRAKELVEQILVFSRQSQLNRGPVKLQVIIKEALKMLRASIPTTIEIRETICLDCGYVVANPTQIHQILINLCTNAYHAMERTGGILKVELRPADAIPAKLEDMESGYVELSITDTGHGIGPDIMDKIFDPFFTTKEVGKGTGMGLATTYGIVKDHGGTITVDSQLGKGTAFHIYLPQTEQTEALQETDTDIQGGKERILFIDDEKILTEMARDMLERLGYEVTAAMKSFEALEVFQNQPDSFDLVITDQTMPGLTGLEIARRMMRIRPDIPIILCTGYSNLVDEEVAKAQGIKAFALKPFTKSTFARLIRKVLEAG